MGRGGINLRLIQFDLRKSQNPLLRNEVPLSVLKSSSRNVEKNYNIL